MPAYLIWFALGFLFILVELQLPHFILVFFGVGCWIAALSDAFLGVSIETQILVFIAATLVSLGLLRRFLKRLFTRASDVSDEDVDMEMEHVGRVVEVVQDIPAGGVGRVKHRGSFWDAGSRSHLPAGAMAKIVGRSPNQGAAFVVAPLEEGDTA
jgi:membrane protein implicated in regulation of membrane protease activity